jgi:hypothetical protein
VRIVISAKLGFAQQRDPERNSARNIENDLLHILNFPEARMTAIRVESGFFAAFVLVKS